MKKYVNIIVNFILILAMLISSIGCEKDTVKEEREKLYVYYVDKEGTKINSENYYPNNLNDEKLLSTLITEKLSNNGEKEENIAAIPENVIVRGFDITDGILIVDFNENYREMSAQQEVLCRAAIVLTLAQVRGVEYVSFTINNQPYIRQDGVMVGNMKASDFVSDLGGGNSTFVTADFKLYFANEDGSKLKEYILSDAKYGEKSKEQFVVEQLIKGTKEKGYISTLSPDLKLISVITANNICYVDFADNFQTEQSKVSNQLVIFSIVNSLSELKDVHKVQISINGDSALKYHDDISLTEPFIRNLDIIESKE